MPQIELPAARPDGKENIDQAGQSSKDASAHNVAPSRRGGNGSGFSPEKHAASDPLRRGHGQPLRDSYIPLDQKGIVAAPAHFLEYTGIDGAEERGGASFPGIVRQEFVGIPFQNRFVVPLDGHPKRMIHLASETKLRTEEYPQIHSRYLVKPPEELNLVVNRVCG